jgi:energy-coupling factor transporter ATP-binding protein EcfA2
MPRPHVSVAFAGTEVRLHGGRRVKLTGDLLLASGILDVINGSNGAGKTLFLAALGTAFNHPLAPVERMLTRPSVLPESAARSTKIAVVREEPLSNFVGGLVADEFRLLYANRVISDDDFSEHLGRLLRSSFGMHDSVLSQNPKTLSGGERQLLAICMAILTGADLLLLDEPLARLSSRNATKVLTLLTSAAAERYVIITSHTESGTSVLLKSPDKALYEVSLTESLLTVRPAICEDAEGKPEASRVGSPVACEAVHISHLSFCAAAEITQNFANLPTNTVAMMVGLGDSLFASPVEVELKVGDRVVTSVSSLDVREGVNILYGDNGAGKTLFGHYLAGHIPHKTFLSIGNGIKAVGTAPSVLIGRYKPDRPDVTTLRWMANHHETFFLPAEPDDLLAEETVSGELAAFVTREDYHSTVSSLQSFGVNEDSRLSELSYGQKKLLSFMLIPRSLTMVIIDEPFSNLSDVMQKELASRIVERLSSGNWISAVIISNRPLQTTAAFVALRPSA